MKPLLTAVFAMFLAALLVSHANAQMLKLTPTMVFSQAGANQPAGSTGTLVRKDRGPHPGTEMVVTTAGQGGGALGPTATEYQLVGPAAVGSLPEIDLLGIHYIKVRPDRSEAFEKFVADKLHPAVGNLRPDLRLLYYKATAGPDAGSYITIFALTKTSRDKYWPNGQDSNDLRAAFTPAVKALATELQTYLVDGSFGTGMTAAVYESKEWADWVVVAPAGR